MKNAFFMKVLTFGSAFAMIGVAPAQEVTFSDYVQPMRATNMGFVSMDNDSFYNVGVTGYSIGVNFSATGYAGKGVRFYNWPANGDVANNGTSGLGIPMYGTFAKGMDYLDITFMYNPETGAPKKFRCDIYDGSNWVLGSSANGGLINLTGPVGQWSRYRTRRQNPATDGFGNPTKPTGLRIVAIQNSDNTFPAFGGTYIASAGLTFDCARVAPPRRLNGLYKVTGSTNKDVGTILFNNTGGLYQYNDWIQNLGNVDVVNVYGRTNFGNLATTVFSSNLMYTYLDGGSNRQFGIDRLTTGLNLISANMWAGGGVGGNPTTDKFFGVQGLSYPPTSGVVIRQVTTGVYSHYSRTMSNNNGYASEFAIDLGGENLVAMADVNGDGMEDAITRSGTSLKVRPWTGTSGAYPNDKPTYGAATTLTTFGYLKVMSVTDFNDDGIDDLLMMDSVSGDTFSLVVGPSGTATLTWLFTMRLAQNEKFYAMADADNDGYPDIYTTLQRSGDGVGEIYIRKLNTLGTAFASITKVAEYNYTLFAPCAIGDINGDGSADIAMIGNNSPNYTIITFLVNPLNRTSLIPPTWVQYAKTPLVRPIYYYNDTNG